MSIKDGGLVPPKPTTGWIGGRNWDLAFFWGSSLLAAGCGVLVLLFPVLLVPLVWAWLAFTEGPHIVATLQRTYFDADERRRRRRLLIGSLLFLLPGIVLWGATQLTGSPIPYVLFLLFASLASWHHITRQHYGVMAIYEAHANASRAIWRFDKWFLGLMLWGIFGLNVLAARANRYVVGLPNELPPWLDAVVTGGFVAIGIAVVVYVVSIVWRSRRGMSIRPALFALFPVLGLLSFTFFVVGAFEPIVAAPTTAAQFILAMTLVAGLSHSIQYLGIVFIANRRRYKTGLPSRPWLLYGALVAASLVFLLINAGRSEVPALAFFEPDSAPAQFFVAVFWGVYFHHYFLDQYIWRIRSDERLRVELGLVAS